MKYVIFLGDGMSDRPLEALGGRTPLMAARTTNMDRMVREGIGGWSLNTPDGYYPGSDIANLGVLGYDVTQSYTGRSPLEAAAMGVELGPDDIAFRCNLVTLADQFSVMGDFSAEHISSAEASKIIETLNERLGSERFQFYPGVSYRHLLVWRNGGDRLTSRPPHDISDKPIEGATPEGPDAEPIFALMRASWEFLADHPVNLARVAQGKRPANSIWLWGHGRKPVLPRFQERFGKSGGIISAVDLMRGIAAHIGFDVLHVPGATGWIDTDYEGKARACLEGLETRDLMFVHVESPDEAGHAGRMDYKLKAIEDFDARLVGPVLEALARRGPFRAMALPDHPTPLVTKTHDPGPVPFAMVGHGIAPDGNQVYDENLLRSASVTFDPGIRLMPYFLNHGL
ncbi:2,3-bisphosphoglycerate-independent phosphoglycerate mutase [Candidatus Magnetaquicoccaceae bacterium FCR-1]|uniref:2,3-bisphosphoglycerate-independent phosphoglycerate mutase n=1 Tax=Candidatus Magnetaquiglobus chichijimensis TaxID=3141448 RepID=A0ABQ0C5Y8_9PROT